MKKLLAILLSASIASFGSVATQPNRIVLLEKGAITTMENGNLVFSAKMTGGADWAKFENFEEKLAYTFETMDGTPVMVIRNKNKGSGDTAWNLTSRRLRLPPRTKRLLLEIDCRATTRIGHDANNDYWSNRVTFYGHAGTEISHVLYKYKGRAEGFTLTQIPIDVPAGSVAVTIQLGADNPNINGNHYQAYRSIQLKTGTSGGDFTGNSSFVSQIFKKTPGRISWTGDFPEGSTGSLQLSWAPMVHGAPGKWSAFIGPDGTANSSYQNNAPLQNLPEEAVWLRYRFTFHSGKKPSLLRKIQVGQYVDGDWNTHFSAHTPMIANITRAARDFRKTIAVKILPSTLVDWSTLRFAIDGADVTGKIVVRGNTVSYTPEKPFEDRLHSFTVTIGDIDGNMTTSKRYFDFADVSPSRMVTLRDDGMTLLNGEPFFPVGIFSVAKKPWNNHNFDNAFRDIKAANFNIAHTYHVERSATFYNEFLPAARKHGLKLFFAGPLGANSHNTNRILETIRKDKENPDIVSWYLADDSSVFWTADELAELADAVKAVDPSRLVSQADGTSGYDGFANSTDIFIPEIYPVMGDDPESNNQCVSKVIQGMRHTFERIELEGNPNISVWALLQYFKGWGNLRYPTPRELRAMSYASIIEGAHGVMWYTYAAGDHVKNHGAASSPESWQVMSAMATELHQMTPVLSERKASFQPEIKILSGREKDELDYPAISGILKHHDGKAYWIALNSTTTTIQAAFTLPASLKGGKVLFENREITVDNGVLTDSFGPYDVHVYELQ